MPWQAITQDSWLTMTDQAVMAAEIQSMLEKQAIKPRGGFILSGPVINLKRLNEFVHIKMEGIHVVKVKVDLYFAVPIHKTIPEISISGNDLPISTLGHLQNHL